MCRLFFNEYRFYFTLIHIDTLDHIFPSLTCHSLLHVLKRKIMAALLRSSSSSGFSESLHSDTLSEDPILESYPQASEIEVERYNDYSYSHDEDPEQETIVITAPPWGTEEEEPVSIIIDEDLNHISLDAKSQSNFSYSRDHVPILDRASSSNNEINDTYELRLKSDDASTDLVTISSHDAVSDAVHNDVNEKS